MEKLVILRMFLCLPLIGFLFPDVGLWLSNKQAIIPAFHLMIEVTLLIFISICSIFIFIKKRGHNNTVDTQKDPGLLN
jgi:hypothetical protein